MYTVEWEDYLAVRTALGSFLAAVLVIRLFILFCSLAYQKAIGKLLITHLAHSLSICALFLVLKDLMNRDFVAALGAFEVLCSWFSLLKIEVKSLSEVGLFARERHCLRTFFKTRLAFFEAFTPMGLLVLSRHIVITIT